MKRLVFLLVLFVAATAWAKDKDPADHPAHHSDLVTSATFQFIDYSTCYPPWNFFPNPPITATATQTTAYLDCTEIGGGPAAPGPGGGGLLLATKPIPLSNGVTDGQILTLVCNSNLAGGWTIVGSFDAIDSLLLGGPDLGSFDAGLTINPGNGSSSSDQSCSATLMWSNENQWWELVSMYGGTDN